MKRGFERMQRLKGCVGPRALVDLEFNLVPFRLRSIRRAEAYGHGHDFVIKFPRLNRGCCLLMAAQRELVRLFPSDSIAMPDALRRQAHGKISVGIMIHEPRI